MRRGTWRGRGAPSRAALAGAGIGAVMLACAVGYTPVAWPAGVAGAAAAALAGRWAAAGTLAACAAMLIAGIGIASGTLPLPAAAAEGTLILAYLLSPGLAGAPLSGGPLSWIRERGPVLAAALAAALLTALAAEATLPAAPWLAVIGVAAVGAALLVAAG